MPFFYYGKAISDGFFLKGVSMGLQVFLFILSVFLLCLLRPAMRAAGYAVKILEIKKNSLQHPVDGVNSHDIL